MSHCAADPWICMWRRDRLMLQLIYRQKNSRSRSVPVADNKSTNFTLGIYFHTKTQHAESNLQQDLMISSLFCKSFKMLNYLCTLSTQILVYFSQISSKEQHNCEVKKENVQFIIFSFFFTGESCKKDCMCLYTVPSQTTAQTFRCDCSSDILDSCSVLMGKGKNKEKKRNEKQFVQQKQQSDTFCISSWSLSAPIKLFLFPHALISIPFRGTLIVVVHILKAQGRTRVPRSKTIKLRQTIMQLWELGGETGGWGGTIFIFWDSFMEDV